MAKTKFEIYKDKKGTFRWRLLAQNGEAVASSGEGFKERRTVMNAVKKLKDWANTETVIDLDKMKEEAKKAKEAASKKKVANKNVKPVSKTTVKKPAKKAVSKEKVVADETSVKTVL